MTPEAVFALTGTPAMAGWLILILGPRRYSALNVLTMWVIPLGLSAVYSGLALAHFSGPGGGYGTLAEVRQLLSSDWTLMAAWAHFLAFDLFVGAIMAQRMDQGQVDRITQGGILVLILMLGPLGFLLAALLELGLRSAALLPKLKTKGTYNVSH